MAQYHQFHQHSRRIALCGLITALSTLLLSAGSVIPLATFASPMLAMLCLLPVLCDCGAKYALLVYTASSLLALMLCTDKELALFYLFLGWYPVLRPKLSRLPRPVRMILKCAIFTFTMAVMYAIILFLFQLEAVIEEFAGYSTAMLISLLLMGNATFLLQDVLLTRMSILYVNRRKKR